MLQPHLQFDPDALRAQVPLCLRERAQWVCWRLIKREGKPTKVPVCATTGDAASSIDPGGWVTFDQALAACSRDPTLAGIGFVFSPDDPFAGIDLDDCRDPQTGAIKPWARDFLEKLNSYAETSPSGCGVKAFVRAAKAGNACKKGYQGGAVEIYDRERFFTVTGARLTEYSSNVEERQAQLDAVYVQVFPKPKPPPPLPRKMAQRTAALSDDEIVKLASENPKNGAKFSALWAGEWQARYRSASEADSALVFRLAFYTKDAAQIDRLFRRSGLLREKWDEQRGQARYGESTITKALDKVTKQYDPNRPTKNANRTSPRLKPVYDGPALGSIDPQSGRIILATDRTLPTAEAFTRKFCSHPDGMTLRSYAGQFMGWKQNRYVEVEDGAICHTLLPWLHGAVRMAFNPQSADWEPEDFPANPATMKAALESIRAYTHLPASKSSPCWLDNRHDRPDPRDLLPCRSSLLHLPTMRRMQPTPLFFCVNALDFDHDPAAPEPAQWQGFLSQLFEDDLRSWDLLQEWFGYCLVPDTSQQKMLLIVGPKRSGKGTIARVLRKLAGPGNVCGPTTSSLAGNFGLQPLLGKSLAIVSDARFTGDHIQTVVERLLCISGEDAATVDRKHLPSVTVDLPTRFVFLTNELPRLTDASGALAGRFVMLRLTESFYGREDLTLTNRLLQELPGLLNWSIEGWRRLRERGHFVQPGSVADALRELEDLASPVGAFVRDWCVVGPDHRIWVGDLYAAWQRWCAADGRVKVMTKQMFGRNLMAAVPTVSTRCGTDSVRFYEGIALKESQP